MLDPASEGFIVELTASEAEVNDFITQLGTRANILEVVRSGALGIGRAARALKIVGAAATEKNRSPGTT